MGAFVVVLEYIPEHGVGDLSAAECGPCGGLAECKRPASTAEETSLAAGLAKAKAKPVLVDFWATWCKNCLLMNNTVLKDEAVLKRLDGFVKIKYQAEDPTASPTKEIWEHFKLVGLPTYVIKAKWDRGLERGTASRAPKWLRAWDPAEPVLGFLVGAVV